MSAKNIDENDIILESHRKIYNIIRECINYNNKEKYNYIELKCDDTESSKEWINIQEINVEYNEETYKKLVDDYIKEIKKYRLEETKKEVMNKIKEYESQGKIEESLRLATELVKIKNEIGRL